MLVLHVTAIYQVRYTVVLYLLAPLQRYFTIKGMKTTMTISSTSICNDYHESIYARIVKLYESNLSTTHITFLSFGNGQSTNTSFIIM